MWLNVVLCNMTIVIIDFQVDGYNRMTIKTGSVMNENLEFWTMIQYFMYLELFIHSIVCCNQLYETNKCNLSQKDQSDLENDSCDLDLFSTKMSHIQLLTKSAIISSIFHPSHCILSISIFHPFQDILILTPHWPG